MRGESREQKTKYPRKLSICHYINGFGMSDCLLRLERVKDLKLLSFQLKCSSNIDSIHYLRLTNSFHQVPRDIHTLPVKEPIPSI